jgi:hypothetical protein
MNYHERSMKIIQQAQVKKLLFSLLMEVARKNPKVFIEAGQRLGLTKKPVVPPALVKGSASREVGR